MAPYSIFENVHMSNKILGFICAFPDFWKKLSAAFKQLCLLFIGKGEKIEKKKTQLARGIVIIRRILEGGMTIYTGATDL